MWAERGARNSTMSIREKMRRPNPTLVEQDGRLSGSFFPPLVAVCPIHHAGKHNGGDQGGNDHTNCRERIHLRISPDFGVSSNPTVAFLALTCTCTTDSLSPPIIE